MADAADAVLRLYDDDVWSSSYLIKLIEKKGTKVVADLVRKMDEKADGRGYTALANAFRRFGKWELSPFVRPDFTTMGLVTVATRLMYNDEPFCTVEDTFLEPITESLTEDNPDMSWESAWNIALWWMRRGLCDPRRYPEAKWMMRQAARSEEWRRYLSLLPPQRIGPAFNPPLWADRSAQIASLELARKAIGNVLNRRDISLLPRHRMALNQVLHQALTFLIPVYKSK